MALPRFSWVTVRFLLDRKLILHFILFLYIVGVASAGESGSAGSAGEAGETRLSMARQAGGLKPAANADQTTRVRLNEAYGKLPLSFEANQGQTDPQVKFLSRGRGYGLFLTSREAVLTLAGSETKSETKNDSSALQRQARIPNPESRPSSA